ncbi:MAG: ATPase [Sphingosinicella sp.]|nr:ATPase [Sphingosinicella sp.]
MSPDRKLRAYVGAAVALIGLLAAIFFGAPILAASLALVAGGGAMAMATARGGQPIAEDQAETKEQPLPDAVGLLAALEEPALIVRDRRVILANESAKTILGAHIEGVDIRLAIRHPAAAERLSRPDSGQAIGPFAKTELTGLGDAERRWEMATASLPDGSRLVRLTDRSEYFASERMRGDFVANASHELRTPLATLLGFLETLQDEKAASDKKTRSRFIQIMFEEARRMHRLVDDLISLSRIEAERFTAPLDSVDLLPLIEEVRGSCHRLSDETQSEILVEQRGARPVVVGDERQLAQLLQNLIVNALKYGRNGTPATVGFEDAGEMLAIKVTDRGEGIAPEHLPRLTERFYRADPGRSRAVGGTGLGLAIVKHIVERHRGRLDIQSIVGEGTTIRVYLPKAGETSVIKES